MATRGTHRTIISRRTLHGAFAVLLALLLALPVGALNFRAVYAEEENLQAGENIDAPANADNEPGTTGATGAAATSSTEDGATVPSAQTIAGNEQAEVAGGAESVGALAGELTLAAANSANAAYPWADSSVATGNYLADSYTGLSADHVFESVTQERLLDILSSEGNYYVVFGGPSRATAQTLLPLINEQAHKDGIAKIYHFDPLIDGYQADITKTTTPYKVSASATINQLWTRITALLPEGAPLASYDSADTLLFLYKRNEEAPGTRGSILASYRLAATDSTTTASDATQGIANVFRGGSSAGSNGGEGTGSNGAGTGAGSVIAASVRSDLAFFNRVYNAGATSIEGSTPSANRIGAPVTLFDGLTEASFKLHQINFAELLNLYRTPGEHIIFYGASWCHNTQAIIGTVAATAAQSPGVSTVYVYDTTLGNQLTFGTGTAINTVSGTSSTFNSRNNNSANFNVSYIYAEAVRPLGSFITQNTSYHSDSITYVPNGELRGTATNTAPWAEGEGAKNARRLQLPFLLAFDNSKTEPVVRQWLHAQSIPAVSGQTITGSSSKFSFDSPQLYLEYMLELAWVRETPLAQASATVYGNGQKSDTGQTLVVAAREAVDNVRALFRGVPLPNTEYELPAGNEYTLDSTADLTITIKRAIAEYDANTGVSIDNKILPREAYQVFEGSTKVYVYASYLATLAEGSHILTVPFVDALYGEVAVNIPFTVAPPAPVTPPDDGLGDGGSGDGADSSEGSGGADGSGGGTNTVTNTITNTEIQYINRYVQAPAAGSGAGGAQAGSTATTASNASTSSTSTPAGSGASLQLAPVAIDEPVVPLASSPAAGESATGAATGAASSEGGFPLPVLAALAAVMVVAFVLVAWRLGLFGRAQKEEALS